MAAVGHTMIKPEIATIIIIVFIMLFGVILPILNRRAPKYVSYRWCVVVVILALLIGSVIDFGALPDDARKSIIVGGLVLVGGKRDRGVAVLSIENVYHIFHFFFS